MFLGAIRDREEAEQAQRDAQVEMEEMVVAKKRADLVRLRAYSPAVHPHLY